MGYFDRLPLIVPGTLVATSHGVAVYVASGRLSGGLSVTGPLMQLKRRGCTFLEPSDEWTGNEEESAEGLLNGRKLSIIQLKT